MEVWNSVLDYEGYYEVSNLGNVKSLDRLINFPHGMFVKKGKLLKSSSNGTGYYKLTLSKNGLSRDHYVHRLVIESFVGKNDLHINHINGIRNDNRLGNLEFVTIRENQHKRLLKKELPTGVSRVRNKYRAVIGINGKNIHLGYFETAEMASDVFNKKLKSI
jgi:hypothetical protein